MRAPVAWLALGATLWAGEARALGPVDVGVSALVAGGYTRLDQSSPSSFAVGDTTATYPGFGGFTLGGGVALELRVLGLVGLEVDGFVSRDRGHGQVTQGDTRATVTIGQTAVHIPVLLKGVLPLTALQPFALVGPELVLPLPSSADSDPPRAVRGVVGAERYTMLTVGVGAEKKLPVALLDLRASLSLRGSYRPGSSDELDERVTPLPSGAIIFDGRWRYQASLVASLGAFF